MPEAMLQLGNLAFDRGDAAQALDFVQRYLAVNPATPEILWLGFRAERKLGDNTAAAGYRAASADRIPEFRTGTIDALRRRSMSEVAQTLARQRLKAERERRGMSAQKAADEMHLDAWVIEALEADDYQRIGPSVYAKGHLKKYASILGLPAAEIARRLRLPTRRRRPRAPLHRRASGCARRLPTATNLPWPQLAAAAADRRRWSAASFGGAPGTSAPPRAGGRAVETVAADECARRSPRMRTAERSSPIAA